MEEAALDFGDGNFVTNGAAVATAIYDEFVGRKGHPGLRLPS
jgi:hypothetical protein